MFSLEFDPAFGPRSKFIGQSVGKISFRVNQHGASFEISGIEFP